MLATDGDFNIGQSDDDELKRLIEDKRKSGVFLSVFGFGRGNLNDQMMQTIAQNGNGTAAYIDTLARKPRRCWCRALVDAVHDRQGREDLGRVQSGRGRRVPADRLRDPRAQPRGLQQRPRRHRRDRLGPFGDGDLRDHAQGQPVAGDGPVALRPGCDRQWRRCQCRRICLREDHRYKAPDGDKSKLITTPVTKATEVASFDAAGADQRFSVAVAAFGPAA